MPASLWPKLPRIPTLPYLAAGPRCYIVLSTVGLIGKINQSCMQPLTDGM